MGATQSKAENMDPGEIAKFEALAERWWDSTGEFKPLHDINPLRLDFIDARAGLAGRRVLDVGCGGGILSEGMAHRGADVIGIDLGEAPLGVARLHAEEQGLEIDYRRVSVEALAEEAPASFDVVTCLEMLEHVPDPGSVVRACATLVKPGGQVFFSTLNRNPKALALAVVGAEYLLRMLPRGTHDYAKFIRPAELAGWCRQAGLEVREQSGLVYNPLSRRYRLHPTDVSVNYLMHCRREET
ncbi:MULTISPECIES: bifunctional 2-polyprenyl-6-hydroxyphenol methylase/3-demethylubiquinol 3-O-methyltransferase UbiG [unclassified Halomonas]|uniref:bifunctional 2-polyprenyl-6-hydroxyphenol methylase/3-demethylubiquinol 3-O-methyltransferase UbiG n=1 Tax=unclassified Halomonas TaxID=2609666 RepID=UPI0028889568|nr:MULTISPECIES: bifunctional 2-polyprenyl-6-hydroxyphenol methylase/3-demethylubiquinol 3-O-methyltransferase UbiG [unclassified Halomonas]MDT0499803.1 bifunctional 2-polyprenyl-6-hydroxyphenol methylase/3-demethylubiquinol 3-O-methyltransferase UbiG [Halomonas sp. PAR7]MDT0510380.1 bifunctional 2-polyprenyl-6-hydroxyphenol methylase/3-demethylubiquinol 3-O-methyltransferase UbiG [Halomonas sp. LES1]MDT0589911.1 bifunctional 2-polyprenyl-6-hydroxyphenol methylase/3-demethylubiquinol 3-O-methylt